MASNDSEQCWIALVVDDEVLVRMATADLVSGLGITVIEAESGDAARALIEDGLTPDILITDVQMPGPLDGVELAFWTRNRLPEVPIVLVSGYSSYQVDGIHLGRMSFLSKPYSPNLLITVVRQALVKYGFPPRDNAARAP